MKIAFVDPEGLTKGLNTGIGYMSAVLREAGHETRTIDFNNKPGNEERIAALKDVDIIGISIRSFTLEHAESLIAKIRSHTNAALICGGPHITLDGINFLRQHKEFELGAVGEAEQTITEIADGMPHDEIKGIIYRKDDEIAATERKEWRNDVDAIPCPDYDNFDSIKGKIKSYPLITSRGCPYSCVYCSVPRVIGKVWRPRSAENVIAELRHARERYKSNEFEVLDDNFTLDMRRAKKICQLMIDEGIDIKWSCRNGVRADRLDSELLRLMRQAGCHSIGIGIESLVPEIFDNLNKGERIEDIKNAVMMAKQAGIHVTGFFIVGLPLSTYEKDKQSMKAAKQLGLDSSLWGMFVPYPGTDTWDWVLGNAKMLHDWKSGFHMGKNPKPVFETDDYSEKERIKAYYEMNIKTMGLRKLLKSILKSR